MGEAHYFSLETSVLLSCKILFKPLPSENDDLNLLSNLVELYLDGNYHSIACPLDSSIFDKSLEALDISWSKKIEKAVNVFLSNSVDVELRTRQSCLLVIGAAALQLFVQNNWTGPVSSKELRLPLFTEDTKESVLDELASNYDVVYNLTRRPELLLFARILFSAVTENVCPSKTWWQFRFNRIYQTLLYERNSQLYYSTVESVENCLSKFHEFIGDTEKSILLAEASHYASGFGDVTRSKKYLTSATEILGIDVNLTGALAKRTRFQQTPYSQLVVKITKQRNSKELFDIHDSSVMPVDVKLEDEALLHKIAFINIEDNEIETVLPEELAVVLATCIQHQKSMASDDMLKEELVAFVEYILSQPIIWSFHFNALLLRSFLEKERMKKVERAMMQVNSLVDMVNEVSDTSVPRLHLFYCTSIPPFWKLEKELAQLFMSLGSIKSALEIFLRLELWEDVVFCYKRLHQNEKALKVVENQMEIKETPLLWCLMGDVKNDPTCYEKAWELSKHRSARSQRSLAYYYFDQKKYQECIPYFAKAVELSSLDQKVWFSYGHAATQVEDYELATKCYRLLLSLDSDSYEAWNNLSNGYIKMKQKPRAWKTLQEALKCNYEEWRIWENYLLVSMDVGAFEDVIKAWHRLIELRGKHIDEEILELLVNAIVNDVIDINQKPASGYKHKALELLGHITATATNSAKTWLLYGKLLGSSSDARENPETLDRVVQYYQKAYRNSLQTPGWEKKPESTLEVISYVLDLSEAILSRITLSTDETQIAQLKQAAKLSLKSVLTLVTKNLEDYMYGLDTDRIESQKDILAKRLEELEI